MKPSLYALTLSSLLFGALEAQAQPTFKPKIVPKPELDKKIDSNRKASDQIKKAEPTGERYSLHMSFAPRGNDSDDPRFSTTSYECYGTLKINGETWWEMPRKTSDRQQLANIFIANNVPVDPDKDGYSLTKSNAYNKGREFEFDVYNDSPQTGKLDIQFRLWDSDTSPTSTDFSKDDLFGTYDVKLDLLKQGAGKYYWYWVGGNGNGSDFYLHIRHVKSLYDNRGSSLSKVEVGPVIVKPQFPGKGVGPGPVIKGAPRLKKVN